MAHATGSKKNPIDLTGDDARDLSNVVAAKAVIPTSFTSFCELPLELRQKIWQYALPGPRFIKIRSINCFDKDGFPEDIPGLWGPICIERAPSIFWACHEAKAEVCRIYTPFKGNRPGTPIMWVDFSKDYMCFCSNRFAMHFGQFLDTLPRDILDTIRFLALHKDAFILAKRSLPRMAALEELALYLGWWTMDSPFFVDFKGSLPKGYNRGERGDIPTRVDNQHKMVVEENPRWKAPLVKYGRFAVSEEYSA